MRKSVYVMVVVLLFCSAIPFLAGASQKDDVYEVVFIPKLIGIPWYASMENGLKEYAETLGGMKITVSGAPDPDPAQQARILEDAIAKGPDCIMVVPNDPATLEPLLKRAQDAGIDVITQEAASIKNATADVEFLINEIVGEQYIEALVEAKGSKGGYAIMVGGLTNESHNARADAMVAYQEKNYPDLYQVSERLEGSESVPIAHDKTLELIQAHDDLLGVLYVGTLGPIGGANAVEEKNLIGEIAIIGTATPSQAKDYLARGSITACIISNNPAKIGMAMLDIAHKLFIEGKSVSDIKTVPHFGDVKLVGKAIYFHAEAYCTAENADEFGF
jgi:simple sugar transport system substrate-binding protein